MLYDLCHTNSSKSFYWKKFRFKNWLDSNIFPEMPKMPGSIRLNEQVFTGEPDHSILQGSITTTLTRICRPPYFLFSFNFSIYLHKKDNLFVLFFLSAAYNSIRFVGSISYCYDGGRNNKWKALIKATTITIEEIELVGHKLLIKSEQVGRWMI